MGEAREFEIQGTYDAAERGRLNEAAGRASFIRECPIPPIRVATTRVPVVEVGNVGRYNPSERLLVSRSALQTLNDDELTAVFVRQLGVPSAAPRPNAARRLMVACWAIEIPLIMLLTNIGTGPKLAIAAAGTAALGWAARGWAREIAPYRESQFALDQQSAAMLMRNGIGPQALAGAIEKTVPEYALFPSPKRLRPMPTNRQRLLRLNAAHLGA